MLDLPGNYHDYDNKFYINGDIHESLVELQQLKYLNLSGNFFEGSNIPSFLGSLRNLKYLDLSNCNFEGQIPVQFESLSNLKYLNLSNNNLDGFIPRQLGDLSNLQFLDLNRNLLEGSIPCQLGNLSNLQFLGLNENSLKGKIPTQFGKLMNLQELYLGGYDSALTIGSGNYNGGQWLSNLTSLTHLHMLSISDLYRFHSLFQMIDKLPKLRELSLSECSLVDRFIHPLNASKFNFSNSLSILDLSENNFASFMIFQWLSNISSNLVQLDLSHNLLETPPSYGYGIPMKSLERLYLTDNRLKGGVFKSFINVCTLRSLVLYANNFTEDLQSILHNLSSGCVRNSLQVLDLRWNGITGTLPDFSIFTSFKTLYLSHNQLSGRIPPGSSLPFQLEYLDIGSNSLEGGIPKSFWMNACKLKSLLLYNNRFNDELQVIIHHLSRCSRYSLKELDLSYNQFNGTLPDLSIFSFLEIFVISKNRLNGKIFEDIRFPTNLRTLWMDSNSLNGVISDFQFSGMSMLRELDLSDNSLALRFTEDWIPRFQLRHIGLRSCKFGPTFPKWIQTQIL